MSPALRLSPDLVLPLEAVTETAAILGIRGSGKTNTAVVFAEELLGAGQQVVAIDPTDAWWGLKYSADGAQPAHAIAVLGGLHGDLPLAAGDGATIADFVVEHRASVILSLRHFESKADMRRFVTEFCNRLYHRKGEADRQTPLMLIIDEASLFVPQRVMGEDARMVGAIQRLVRQGRSSGFGVTLIDQRASTVNKDVLTQLELLICHRTSAPQDRKALEAWIEQHDAAGHRKEFLQTLAGLEQGAVWCWSPGWLDLFKRAQIRARRTFDSSRTPKAGERVQAPTVAAAIDLDALKVKLAATLEQAKADDPKVLRARIRELEQQVRQAPASSPDQITAAVQRAMRELQLRGEHREREVRSALEEVAADLRSALDAIARVATYAPELLSSGETVNVPPPIDLAQTTAPMTARVVAVHDRTITLQHVGITKPAQRILNALAFLESVGIAPAERIQAAFFAGYTVNGHFNNTVGSLNTAGLIEYPSGGQVALTREGRKAADAGAQDITTRKELHALWLGKLAAPEQKVLTVLLREYPRDLDRATLARAAGYTENGHFNNTVGHLVSLGAATYPTRGRVRAADVLFPGGLR